MSEKWTLVYKFAKPTVICEAGFTVVIAFCCMFGLQRVALQIRSPQGSRELDETKATKSEQPLVFGDGQIRKGSPHPVVTVQRFRVIRSFLARTTCP